MASTSGCGQHEHALFRVHAIRRVAVVREGQFIGMMTVDDLLIGMADALSDLARPITAEVIFGGTTTSKSQNPAHKQLACSNRH